MSNSENKIIYLPIMGRIGNQLFQYAFAFSLMKEYGDQALIVVDESDVDRMGWVDSLRDYDLDDTLFIKKRDKRLNRRLLKEQLAFIFYSRVLSCTDGEVLQKRERAFQKVLNHLGLIAILRGYSDYWLNKRENLYLYGYFQSERYFEKYKNEIKALFCLDDELRNSDYPYIDEFYTENSVCISIKIEHNEGSTIYDVCDVDYYRKAIDYIIDHVNNPLFFLCSDNVNRAKELFFQGIDGRIVCQPENYPVSLTLCAMSKCKHFVINNTSFGWWAQFLAENEDKIVVAPSKWKNNNDPVSIYDNQTRWHLI